MVNHTKESVSCQVESCLGGLESSKGLPFREFLSEGSIRDALKRAGVEWRKRIYTPSVTIWAFLSQVISKEGGTCENAVARVIADRVARGEKANSADTSSYCAARLRLPEEVLADLARDTGKKVQQQAMTEWRFKGRNVGIVDGSTDTMADTNANQKVYPQSRNQKAGLGFPILRFVVVLSLSVGTVLEAAIGPCRGKHTGELSLFRTMWNAFEPGDIALADRLYDSYRDIAMLKARGVDVVFGKKQSRRCDFRRGRKLGRNDHVVTWAKPRYDSSRYESRAQWEALPAEMEMREVRLTVRRKGYRTRTVTVVTTLLDAEEYSAKDLTDLFRERWHCELDLRSIKQTLGMHHLKCKTPEMVRKELWAYLLAYNVIRHRMAQAAELHGKQPRRLSFSAAMTLIHNFAPYLSVSSEANYERLEAAMLKAITQCPVGNRPNRSEPRAVKKRKQTHPYLTKPRAQARQQLAT